MEFNKFLMGIHNGLGSKDMRKLRFLCRDLDIPIQSLEQLQRGLHLFKELQKMMLLSKGDVSLLIELMGAISRKDLVNKVSEWASASEYSKPRISQYRRLLLCIALDLTSEEFEDMKSMASGPISSNMEEIKDPLEFFVVLEKECLISRKDVAFLHDILPNPQMKEKVKECERDVLGHTPSGTSAAATPIPPSSTTARGIYPQERRQPNPPSLGESGNIYPLHSHPYFVQEPGTHHPNPYMVQPSSAPYQTYQNIESRPEENACPPDSQVQQTYTNLILGRDSRMDNPHHMFQPLSSAVTSNHPYGASGVSPNTHHVNVNPTSGYHIRPTAIIQPQSAASYSSQPPGVPSPQAGPCPPNMQQTSANYSGVRGTIPGQHPGTICHGGDQHYQATPYAANRTDFPQQQDVLGMERSFRNLSVMQKQEEKAKVCIRQMPAQLQQGAMLSEGQNPNVAHQLVLGSNETFPQETGDAPTASNAAAPVSQKAPMQRHDQTEHPRGQRADTRDLNSTGQLSFAGNFPPDLDKQIQSVCKNVSVLQPADISQLTVGSHLLDLDGPNTDPSSSDVSPFDLKIPARGEMPCYERTHNQRGYAIIINNEKFVAIPGNNLEFRRGSAKDAVKLLSIFYKFKFMVRCANNQSAGQMYDLLELFRKYDHRQYDCFVCCILSHGREGEVYGSDGMPIPIRDLTSLFTGVKCPSLAGKPKLFFIQACQGEIKQVGVKPLVETDSPQDSIATIPNESDFLVGYSTVSGYASYRDPEEGSWYVISLVEHLEKYHGYVDMQNILALVNGHMAKCSDAQGYKQSSSHKSTLTKALYL